MMYLRKGEEKVFKKILLYKCVKSLPITLLCGDLFTFFNLVV